MDDIFRSTTRFLQSATNGASYTQLMNLDHDLSQDDIKSLLNRMLEKGLVEFDKSSLTYWTTIDGIKFLELQFNMEQILKSGDYT